MFSTAHRQAREDRVYDPSKSHAHYFRLRLLNLHAEARDARAVLNGGLVIGFRVIEPKRLWA